MNECLGSCRKHCVLLALLALVATVTALAGETGVQGDSCVPTEPTAATTITFDNQSGSAISTYRLNERCEEVAYGTIQPQGTASQPTYKNHTWRIRGTASQWLLREVKADIPPVPVRVLDLTTVLQRPEPDRDPKLDRDDDVPGYYQVKVLYVVPAEGKDRELDTNGQITRSIAAMQFWFAQQTGGRRLRLDTYEGALDIAFVRLDRSEEELREAGVLIRDEIEEELNKKKGYNESNKIYAVYYDGAADECGSGPWPPRLIGNVAALYLRGKDCPERFAKSVAQPRLDDLSVAHEILHTLGLVAACAPNHTRGGHVSDSPKDLMYAGPDEWQPSILDVGRNDYFEHGNPWCEDLARSVFLDPLPEKAELPPGWRTKGNITPRR